MHVLMEQEQLWTICNFKYFETNQCWQPLSKLLKILARINYQGKVLANPCNHWGKVINSGKHLRPRYFNLELGIWLPRPIDNSNFPHSLITKFSKFLMTNDEDFSFPQQICWEINAPINKITHTHKRLWEHNKY